MGDLFKFLDGYKLKIGMLGATATLVAELCKLLADGFQVTDLNAMLASFSAYMVVIGAGHKLVKMEDSIKK